MDIEKLPVIGDWQSGTESQRAIPIYFTSEVLVSGRKYVTIVNGEGGNKEWEGRTFKAIRIEMAGKQVLFDTKLEITTPQPSGEEKKKV